MTGCYNLRAITTRDFFSLKILRLAMPFLILFISSPLRAQRTQIDSLKKSLIVLQDTARIDCLNNLSIAYLSSSKDSSMHYANSGLEEAETINYMNGVAVSLFHMSQIVKRYEDDFLKSERLARESLSWYEKTNNKQGINEVFMLLCVNMFAQSRYQESIEFAGKSYELSKQAKSKPGINMALSFMGTAYRESGDYEKSFYYHRRVYDIELKEDKGMLSLPLFALGELFMHMEDYPSALNYFRRARQIDSRSAREIRLHTGWDIWVKMEFAEIFSQLHQFDSAWYYYNLYKPAQKNNQYDRVYLVSTGECYFLQKNYKLALQSFLQALPLHLKLNDQNQVMRTLLNTAKTFFFLKQNSEALKYASEGLVIAQNKKAKQYEREGNRLLYLVYDRLQKTDSAYFFYKRYRSLNDSVTSAHTKAKFNSYNYEQRIRLLSSEKTIQHARLEKESFMKKLLAVGILILLILGFFITRNIKLNRRNERLRLEGELNAQQHEHQRRQSEFQQRTTELEMQALRAQMNPHFIFNSLNSINRFILQNNKTQASEYLTKFSCLIRLILQNSQASLISLESELESLKLYLELEALRFDHHFEFTIKIDEDLDTSSIKVPPLIIQPYVENAIWHGLMPKEETGYLEVQLLQQEEILCCKISDNGIGRKKATELKSKSTSSYKSLGMKITADRIAIMQNEQEVETCILITDLVSPDGTARGTEVFLKIPLMN